MSGVKRGGFESEAALAAVVVSWLRGSDAQVFQEVEHRGDIADIVATRADEVLVVECKLSSNLHLLEQAWRWRERAHRVYIAVPFYGGAHRFARVVCEKLGIGVLKVTPPSAYRPKDDPGKVHIIYKSPLREPDASRCSLLSVLRPEHQTYAAAGSPTGARFTPFRATAQALVAYVVAHPGERLRVVLDTIPTHWPKKVSVTAVVKLIERGVIPGVRVEGTGREIRIFPVVGTGASAP